MAEVDDEQLELIQEFLIESYEGLDRLDQDLVSLEDDPANAEILQGVFRTFHTIKGTAGFLAFSKLETVAHAAENLLSKLRDGVLALDPERASALLQTVDAIREILACVEETQEEGNGSYDELVGKLGRLLEPGHAPAPAAESAPVQVGVSDAEARADAAPATQDPSAPEPEATRQAPPSPESSEATQAPRSSAVDASIRVDVDLLDSLMNLVGELVLTRNQILQFASTDLGADLSRTTQRLNLITSDLQEGVMKTRMQPIRNVWNKFPRVVRDLTRSCGKQAAIRMEGEDTELDRTILEAIRDPLTHMVRNSVDHGLETAEERRAAGKPEQGTLVLRAYHEGGQVNLEIADDGRGIDVAKIRDKALERGMASREKLDRMSDREVLQLVFLPGFSTAAKVTNVSGRGVGMDVVRTNIEKIGGTVDLQSTLGAGTTVRVKIPLTLAIIPALLVYADGNRYAIPQVSLTELVRIEGERAATAIESVHGAPVYRLRGNLLPLVDLRSALGTPPADRGHPDDVELNIVVLQADDRHYGLVVDEVSDTEEIVVKPLNRQLRDVPVYAGATIMGDGRVALILDAIGIAERAGVLADEHRATVVDTGSGDVDPTLEWQTLLLLDLQDGKPAAIPLSAVSRLEEISTARIERGGDYWVTQYRDKIMPLVPVGFSELAIGNSHDDASFHVVVHAINGRRIGLVVERIRDIVDSSVSLDAGTQRRGTLGSAVIQGRVTDLLDVRQLVHDALPSLAAATEGADEAGRAGA